MPKDTHKKIALVTISLSGGGAERSTAFLSQMLTGLGHTVHIICIRDGVSYPYEGTLFNLGADKREEEGLITKYKHLKRLKNYLHNEQFDLVIDSRSRSSALKEWVYTKYIYKAKKVLYMVRSARLETYFPAPDVLAKWFYGKHHFVGVSKSIAAKIKARYGFKHIHQVYNPIPQMTFGESNVSLPETYLLGYGRLVDDVKNFSLMISAFAKANLKLPLVIMGDGPDAKKLATLSKSLGINDKVIFIGHQSNPAPVVERALCTLLTSHYEGFPMVLVESLALGTPVISVDCDSGPKEIVQNGINGMLVANYDEVALSTAIRTFVLDGELASRCQKNAQESVKHLAAEHIALDWKKLLDSL